MKFEITEEKTMENIDIIAFSAFTFLVLLVLYGLSQESIRE